MRGQRLTGNVLQQKAPGGVPKPLETESHGEEAREEARPEDPEARPEGRPREEGREEVAASIRKAVDRALAQGPVGTSAEYARAAVQGAIERWFDGALDSLVLQRGLDARVVPEDPDLAVIREVMEEPCDTVYFEVTVKPPPVQWISLTAQVGPDKERDEENDGEMAVQPPD